MMRKILPENMPLTLPVVAAEAGRSLCEGCGDEQCYCFLLSDDTRQKINLVIEPEKFIETARRLTRVVRVHARIHDLEIPSEFRAIRKMSRESLLGCLAFYEFTNGQVIMWDGEVRQKLLYTRPR